MTKDQKDELDDVFAEIEGVENIRSIDTYSCAGSELVQEEREDAFKGYLHMVRGLIAGFMYTPVGVKLADDMDSGDLVVLLVARTSVGDWAKSVKVGILEHTFTSDPLSPVLTVMRSEIKDRTNCMLLAFACFASGEAGSVKDKLGISESFFDGMLAQGLHDALDETMNDFMAAAAMPEEEIPKA